MKTIQWAGATVAIFVFTTQSSKAEPGNGNGKFKDTIPLAPVGVLSATPTVVQAGSYPNLNWKITYPSAVDDVAIITAPCTITLTEPVFVYVRPVGVGISQCGRGEAAADIPAEARISVNRSAYDQLFFGTHDLVDPSTSLYIKKHQRGDTIDFGGRYVVGGEWTSFFTSKSSNLQVIALVDGDPIPTSGNLYDSRSHADYLKPYLDGTGKVKIGPLSVLVLMELAETDHAKSCFDYQDLVLMVTFADNHPNNGHGNNLDGVDSSNPGTGSGGPSGGGDPSAGVDDEAR